MCTSNNGTQLTDDCGLADSSYLNFIKDGVCPYAGCLLDVQSGEKLLEECECGYYRYVLVVLFCIDMLYDMSIYHVWVYVMCVRLKQISYPSIATNSQLLSSHTQ